MSSSPDRKDTCIGFRPDVREALDRLAVGRSLASVVNEACLQWLRAQGVEIADEWERPNPAEEPFQERPPKRRRPGKQERLLGDLKALPPPEDDVIAKEEQDEEARRKAGAKWVKKYIKDKQEGIR